MARKNKKSGGQPPAQNSPGLFVFSNLPAKITGIVARFDIVILFAALFIVYNTVSGVGFVSGDVAPASYLPASLILHQSVFFDVSPPPLVNPDLAYAFRSVNGHYVSLFPIVTPVLVTPVYAVSYALYYIFNLPFGDTEAFALAQLLAKTSAAVIAALAGVLVYITAKELFSKRIAILTTFIFAFATSTWSISSQALWQHGTVELLLIAMICIIVKNEKKEWSGYIFILGVLSALYIFNRPPDAVLLIPVLAYVLWYHRSKIPYYVTGGLLSGLPFLWYNYSLFGTVFGGYAENLSLFTLSPGFALHYLGLLIAPNVGLFVFSPVLLVSVLGFLTLQKSADTKIRTLLLLFGPVILLQVLIYSFFTLWSSSAAYCFGSRFLTGFVSVLCIYAGFFLEDLFGTAPAGQSELKTRIVKIVVAGLIISSVCIQFAGTFLYGWTPEENQTMDDDRAWNLSDSIIVRSFTTGLKQVPGISVYILPPLPPLLKYSFDQGSAGG